MQLYTESPPAIHSVRPEHAMNPQRQETEKNIINDRSPFPDNKRNSVLKKNKIQDYDISYSPNIICNCLQKCASKTNQITHQP